MGGPKGGRGSMGWWDGVRGDVGVGDGSDWGGGVVNMNFMKNFRSIAQEMAELWQLVPKRTLLISYIYLNNIPPSDFTVQLSLAKWSWPIIIHIYLCWKTFPKYNAAIIVTYFLVFLFPFFFLVPFPEHRQHL